MVDDNIIIDRNGGEFLATTLFHGAGEKFVGRITRAPSGKRRPNDHLTVIPDRHTGIDVTVFRPVFCEIALGATAA